MWHIKTTTVPVIKGDLGMIEMGTNKHITMISSSPSLHEIQKSAFCGTSESTIKGI